MRSIGRIVTVCLALTLAVTAIVAVDAGAKKKAQKKQVASKITLQAAGVDGISGRVSANGSACSAQRQVGLYRVNSQSSVPTNEYVTSTWTKGDGSWTFPGPHYPGLYFAEVSKKTIPKTKGAGALTCRFAVSNGTDFG